MLGMTAEDQKLWEALCKGVPPEVIEGWVDEEWPPHERDDTTWYRFKPWDPALAAGDAGYDPEDLVGGFSFIHQTHCIHVRVLFDPEPSMVLRVLRHHLEKGALDLDRLPENRWPRPVDGGSQAHA